MDFKELMNTTEYDILRTNERLGNRIMLLGLGGSYAYGTNNEGSDIDFRGVTLMMPSDLLGLTGFEQYEDDKTDTVIVSEINNFAYYKASGGCVRILQGNMPLSAAKIRRSKRQNEKSFVVYHIYGFNKLVKLLLECNPNTCEMLGFDEEQYLISMICI